MGKIPLARYMLNRLSQHGCHHLHGVPGDFCLPFLSHIKTSPVNWIGCTNELNAGYSADGYARATGLGALCTTYGVGELGAINAIGGSFAERVSVVHIVGTPRTALQKSWSNDGSPSRLVHHMLGEGQDPRVYARMAEFVTIKQCNLDVAEGPTETFDETLIACLRERRPVYVQLPSDAADQFVDDAPLKSRLKFRRVKMLDSTFDSANAMLQAKLNRAERPLLMIDGLVRPQGMLVPINDFISKTGIPTVCLPSGLGTVSSEHRSYCGVYAGATSIQSLQDCVNSSDLVLLIGPLLSDTNTAGWSAVPPMEKTVIFHDSSITIDGQTLSIDGRAMLRRLLKSDIANRMADKQYTLPDLRDPVTFQESKEDDRITQDRFYPLLSEKYLKPRDTIMLANGTPLIGANLLSLPQPCTFIASGLWYSVGQMLPAAQGVALARSILPEDKRGRTILLEGDGSFQATATELSTIIRYKLDMTIFIVNNRGYAYEKWIMGEKDDYNNVQEWVYEHLPRVFAGVEKRSKAYPIVTRRVTKMKELEELLADEAFTKGKGLKLVDVVMDKMDVPDYYKKALKKSGGKLVSDEV